MSKQEKECLESVAKTINEFADKATDAEKEAMVVNIKAIDAIKAAGFEIRRKSEE